jgi:UDP-N-acetylmuramoylalanine--D-glutamate ligase
MRLPIDYRPEKVSVLGAARSGLAAAKFLREKDVSVFISDACPPEKLEKTLVAAGCAGLAHEAGGHTARVLDADVIVLSPGVPSDLPILDRAREAGIPVWSEIELAYRFTKGKYLAVTGSTGKSTTVCFLGSILEAAGVTHTVAGNIGVPLIGVVPQLAAGAFVVAEISSFQLENIDSFRPRVSVVLNLLKNHLDRYPSEQAYYDAKKAIAANATKDDYVVLNAGDPLLADWARSLVRRTNVVWFGSRELSGKGAPAPEGVWCENGALFCTIGGTREHVLDVHRMRLRGRHNHENACAAAAAAKLAGVGTEAIAGGIAAFGGLEHRLEFVAEVGGVRYYNDSKSTTAESVACAVNAFENNVYLIAGGRDKGCDFASVKNAVARHAKGVILIGEAAQRIRDEWSGAAPIAVAASLEEAVGSVHRSALSGDVAVFSPGCSSFDMFRNFEHRGKVFKELVGRLVPERNDRHA